MWHTIFYNYNNFVLIEHEVMGPKLTQAEL